MTTPADRAREAVDSLTAETAATYATLWQQITQAEQAVLDGWAHWRRPRRAAELRNLRALVGTLMDEAAAAAGSFTSPTGPLARAFAVGDDAAALLIGGTAPTLPVDRTVLAAAQAEARDALLDATLGVRRSAAMLIGDLAGRLDDLTVAGQPAAAAGRDLAQQLADRRIVAVTYRNGSRHGLDEYSAMTVRTRTAEAYQAGGFARMGAAGIRYVEIGDGSGCGLRSHTDAEKANGLILTLAEARNYPLGHPNCSRTTFPRPDLATVAQAAKATPSTTAAQTADQALVAALRADEVARRAKAAQRFARTRAGLLTDSPFRAGSVAAMRHARRVARRAKT